MAASSSQISNRFQSIRNSSHVDSSQLDTLPISAASSSQISNKNPHQLDTSPMLASYHQISNKNLDQLDTFWVSALISQRRLMQINKSPNSTIVSDQQPEEEKRVLDYGVILPGDIWFWIGKRLESRLDVSRFRSVCRTWRRILPPPFRFPLRVPRPPGPSPKHDETVSYFIAEATFYAANDTVVVFEEENRGGGFSASALVHKDKIIPDMDLELPPVSQISNLSFLCNAYHVHAAFPRLINGERVDNKCDFFRSPDAVKIAILCSDGSANINPNYPRVGDLKVVAHLIDRKLAVLSLGEEGAVNTHWETGFCDIAVDDIVKYRGQLYCVEPSGRAFVMDYNSLHMTQVAPALSNYGEFANYPSYMKLMHLAVVLGDLYMFIDEHDDFKNVIPPCIPRLYKLSFRLGKWVEADQDLPDQVFIQNMHCNFAVSRDLLRGLGHGHDDNNPLPRFCSWPSFRFVRIAVGFKNRYGSLWSCSGRWCDRPTLPYRIH